MAAIRLRGNQIGQMGKKLTRGGGLQQVIYNFSTTVLTSGDILVLDQIPFGLKVHSSLVYVTTGLGSLVGAFGYMTDDGSALPTGGDPDFLAASIDLNTAGPTMYYPPVATAGRVIPGAAVSATATTMNGLTLTLTGATGAVAGTIIMLVEPVA